MKLSRHSRLPCRRAPALTLALTLVLLGTACHRHGGMGMAGDMGMMSHGGMMHRSGQTSGGGAAEQNATDEGERVYTSACAMCHGRGLAGAPRYGDAAAWAPRIKQGRKTLYDHALHGYRGMPAKGGHTDLSDAQVDQAVDHMVKAAGGWGGK